jgi:hypothetical protein
MGYAPLQNVPTSDVEQLRQLFGSVFNCSIIQLLSFLNASFVANGDFYLFFILENIF